MARKIASSTGVAIRGRAVQVGNSGIDVEGFGEAVWGEFGEGSPLWLDEGVRAVVWFGEVAGLKSAGVYSSFVLNPPQPPKA